MSTTLQKKLLKEISRYNSINKYVLEQQTQPPSPNGGNDAAPPPPAPAPPVEGSTPPAMDTTPPPTNDKEEVDVTDIVNMTKDVSTKMDQESTKNQDVVHKMDSVFSKLDDLESKLSEFSQIIMKIDDLEKKVIEMKPLSPEEKLNLRSYDSYPFNQKLSDFFKDKEPEMKMTRKNNYILTPDDVNQYSKDDINKSFEEF